MKRMPIVLLLILATGFQVVALGGMVFLAHLPLWTGKEIRVETQPVDPRSMFRGNYAQLDYAFRSIPKDALDQTRRLRRGEVVYVSLKEEESGLHVFSGASLEPPPDDIFLRGRIANSHPPYRVKFGIEAYFAPKRKAIKLEKELRGGGVAVLMVTENGKGALKAVIPGHPHSDSGSS